MINNDEKKIRLFEFSDKNKESKQSAKAKTWLDENKIKYDFIDLSKKTITSAEFERWINESGLKNSKFVNPDNHALKDRSDNMTIKQLSEYLSSHPLDINRPILEINHNKIIFGFEESKYAEYLGDTNERYMKDKK